MSYMEDERPLKILTGIPCMDILNTLVDLFEQNKENLRLQKLTIKENIILVFFKLKLDIPYNALSILFGKYQTLLYNQVILYIQKALHTKNTPAGLICFVSKAYLGRASDKSIFEQSKLIECLEPYRDYIIVDKGFSRS
ncbi:hypothetical protein ILUMI_00288 [Ignelater luminosus]|uniref:DDE Tnp4 domain-containing protein n=1 Tax=Ignelater luminosus TaxID=2038154 RepID=A0A8K0DM63_IGNLU|nr:hypothetical protein ILUMI_00288 [Ignelater luminosus]